MNRKRILRSAIFFAVIVTLCVVALPFAITPLINTEQIKTHIGKILHDRTGIEIEFNQLDFILAPMPGVSITDVSAQINKKQQITIRKALVELAPAQLFKGKVTVRRITLQSPELIINNTVSDPENASQSLDVVDFVQAELNRLLSLVPADTDHLDISVTQARSNYFKSMDCQIQITGCTKAVNLQAQISELMLDSHGIPKLGTAVKGRITGIKIPHLSLSLFHDKNTALAGKLKIESVLAHLEAFEDRSIQAGELNLNFNLSKKRLNAHLAPFELVYPKGRIGIDASLDFVQHTSNIEFTGEKIDISQARSLCLPLLDGLDTSETLFDILRAGTAQKIIVGFKGKELNHLFTAENLFLSGYADFVTVKIPGVPIIADNVSGSAEVKNTVLSINSKSGHVGNSVISGGTLDIDLGYDDIVPFSGKFALKVDLAQLPASLISMLPNTALSQEMSKLSNINGRADGVLELNKSHDNNDLDIKVTAENIQVSGNYQRMPLPIHINGGSFLLDKGEIAIKNMSGAIGDSSIANLNADIDTKESIPMRIKSMTANINLQQAASLVDVFPGARKKLGPVKQFSGIMEINDLRVEGPMFSPNLWQVHMTGDVDKGCLIFSDNTKAISGMHFKFNLAPSTIKLSQIDCTIKDLTWLKKHLQAKYRQSIVLPLVLTQGEFSKQEDACLLQGKLHTSFGAKFFFMIDGPEMDKLTPSKVQIEDGKRTQADITFYKNPDMPHLKFSGILDKVTLEKMLHPGSYLYRELEQVTGANALKVSTDIKGDITIKCDKLNLDPLLSLHKTPDLTFFPRPLIKEKQIFFDVNTLYHDGRVYQRVQANVTFDQSATHIDISHARLCGLGLSGQITIKHTGDKPGVLTRFIFNTDQAEQLSLSIGCLTGSQSVLRGSYTIEGELSGHAQNFAQIKSKQNGQLNFQAQIGRIDKATLLSRLLSVLNILGNTDLQQQGFGFNTFTVKVDVKQSVVHIKKAFIDADDMAIIAQGWVDPINDALDITFLVAPFKTIDTIIKNIPIINTIVNGSLISFPARAYGTISDPTIVPLHPSAVGNGLLNLWKNLVQTPNRLMGKNKKSETRP